MSYKSYLPLHLFCGLIGQSIVRFTTFCHCISLEHPRAAFSHSLFKVTQSFSLQGSLAPSDTSQNLGLPILHIGCSQTGLCNGGPCMFGSCWIL